MSFVVQFPLKAELWKDDVLNKRFEIGRHIYNSLVTVTKKRYDEMIKTKLYRSSYADLIEINKEMERLGNRKKEFKLDMKLLVDKRKELYQTLNNLRTQYRINEYSFHADVKPIQKHFRTNIDSFTAQKIATRLWKSYDKLIFGDGEEIHYKRYRSFNSLEGKSNHTGIRFIDGRVLWLGLEIPVIIDSKNHYEMKCKFLKTKFLIVVSFVTMSETSINSVCKSFLKGLPR